MRIPGVKNTESESAFLLLVRGHTWTWQKLPESHVPYRRTDHSFCPIASGFFMRIPGVKNTESESAFLLLVRGHTWTWQKLPESHVPYRRTDHSFCPIASGFFMCIPGV